MIFVFGSNLRGVHGAGAAAYALQYEGAKLWHGTGHHGNSYAIPTKDLKIQTLPIEDVTYYINEFIQYAVDNSDLQFKVTKIGCGLAGFKNGEIAPLFQDAPANCFFDLKWKPYLTDKEYWGIG